MLRRGLILWGLSLAFAISTAGVPQLAVFESERVDGSVPSDEAMEAYLQPYRLEVEEFGAEVIGMAAEALKARARPENGISNLVADSLRIVGSDIFETEIDVAFTNFGGLRRDLEAGPLTVGLITELSPFENFVVLLEMRGSHLKRVLQRFARSGGWPQSGLKVVISSEGEVLKAEIGGEPIDDERVYKVATIDYLYNTDLESYPRDRMLSVTMSGERQRDAIIEYMKRLQKQGVSIRNGGDGRTRVAD